MCTMEFIKRIAKRDNYTTLKIHNFTAPPGNRF